MRMGSHPVLTAEPMWVSLLYDDEVRATMLLSNVVREDELWSFADAQFGMQLEGFTFNHVLVSDADGNDVHRLYLGEWVVEPGYNLEVRWPPQGVPDMRRSQ